MGMIRTYVEKIVLFLTLAQMLAQSLIRFLILDSGKFIPIQRTSMSDEKMIS